MGKLTIQKNVNIQNKKASHDYEFLEKYTAGLVLKGTEIKSIRMGKVSLQDAYCLFLGDEFYVRGMQISPYEMGRFSNHDPKADRKLLLNKHELRRLKEELKNIGLTVVPTRLYINDKGIAKLEIALARGKKLYDKREDIKKRDLKREMERE
ncbi:MAG: SsrA-binding protein SmpB [Flammeovirgaceae bacterium]|nr:SsrA-binding protein SmpB [Flammeovirgaceae bacterium]MDW8288731.1 SsrA-binding protein SmpB [Flammeovirgaceae bacterium]